MKYLSKLLLGVAVIFSFFSCLKKVADLPHYGNGNVVVLTSSVNSVTLTPADSSTEVIQLSWTDPHYAQDSSLYKFVVEIDSVGRNFAREQTVTVIGKSGTALSGRQLNDILGDLGVPVGVASSLEVRVTSSYGNNNEAYASNVLPLSASSYLVPLTVVSSVAGPLTLSINSASSSAVVLSWNAISYGSLPFTYTIQVDKEGGDFSSPQEFPDSNALTRDISQGDLNTAALLAGVEANATNNLQFRVVTYMGGSTVPEEISNVIPIKVTTYLPFLYLWVPGDYQGWSADAAPKLGSTLPDLSSFEGYIYVANPGIGFKINVAPDWNHTSYGDDGTGHLSASGGNTPWPSGAGFYYVKANPTASTYSATKTTWAIIGDGTPGGWGNDTPMTFDPVSNTWVINSVTLTANSLKFRANGEWNDPIFPGTNSSLGGSLSGLTYGGDNIPIGSPGNYKVVLDLSQPLMYKATLTKL